jgi:hypothetical protein
MAKVDVSPETFTLVDFDATEIRGVVERLCDQLGFADDQAVKVEIDESVPLGRVRVAALDPIVLELEGGALEDPKRIRQFFPLGACRVLGRLLLQARDQLDASFGSPPDRDDLSLPLRVAWDTYSAGRVDRLGYESQRQRWLYAFRNRHGFHDGADQAFDVLWTADTLTWSDIERISDGALADRAA